MKILLVEDDPLLQRTTKRMLTHVTGSKDILVVDSAPRAIQVIQLEQVDLIVSDFNLKDSDGGEVLSWIRTYRPELLGRFVFLSASEITKEMHDRVLMKPCSLQTMREMFAEIV